MLRSRNQKEGPPVFSHEFVIQNHADIISCVCMVVFMGLIPQFTNPLASSIIFVQYNKTLELEVDESDGPTLRLDNKPLPQTFYQHGWRDLLNIVFYSFVWVIIHALLQEYIWEKTAKRLRLSKLKLSKYYDSGSLVVFYLVSVVWGIDHIIKAGYLLSPQSLWEQYPHTDMPLSLKFYMLTQMAFWLHCYPELYFMKTKKEKIYSKIVLYTSSLLMIGGAYFMQLQRLALVLLVLHYSVEFLFHACRLLHYYGKDDIAISGFNLWRLLFIAVRIVTVLISVVTLWFGLGMVNRELARQKAEAPPIDEEEGMVNESADPPIDFTELPYRLSGLGFIVILQLWIGWTFINYQMIRSSATGTEGANGTAAPPKLTKGSAKTGKSPKASSSKPKQS
ncbi:translocating chain-associated membrane protein 1-like [Halichondria panicea]|uniref:translocating chain-associated membrane protein 1-like n=1 Tax=Halichondria panicea TaxID=6063 RepID=UPI00312BA200